MPPADHVGKQVRRGLSWSLVGAITTNGMRLVVLAVLGHTLTSADFGVVAAAVSVNVILYGIRDIGVGRALIQRKEIEAGHLTTTFAVSSYLGFALTLLLLLAAPLIGRFFGIERSVGVIRALAFLFALRGIALTSRMVCERQMNFHAVVLIDAGTFAAGSIVSMICAVEGAGPWALVIGYLVEEGLATLLYLVVSPPRVSLRIDRARLRELMSYGTGQTITQITGVLATYGDNVVVGNALGPSALGYYTRAYDLVKLPSFIFESIVGRVLFPAFSRIQDDRARLATVFRRVKFVNALVLVPASAVLIVLTPEVIGILVGGGWESSILPLRILAITILPRTSQKLSVIIVQAAGWSSSVALANTSYMVVVVGGAAISIRWGIAGVATSTAIAIFVVYGVSTHFALRVCKLPLGELVRAHVPGLIATGLVTVATVPVAQVLRSSGSSRAVVVVVAAAAGLVAYLGVVALWLRSDRGDFPWLRDELRRLRRSRRP